MQGGTPPGSMANAGSTSIYALWVPVVVFAHVFAAFWLLKTYFKARSASLFKRGRRKSSTGSARASLELAGAEVGLQNGAAGAQRAGLRPAASRCLSRQRLLGRPIAAAAPRRGPC